MDLRTKALGVQSFRADHATSSEFMTTSYWPSEEAMQAYSNDDDPTAVHHLERDAEYLLELPERAEVFHLRTSCGECGASAGAAAS